MSGEWNSCYNPFPPNPAELGNIQPNSVVPVCRFILVANCLLFIFKQFLFTK